MANLVKWHMKDISIRTLIQHVEVDERIWEIVQKAIIT